MSKLSRFIKIKSNTQSLSVNTILSCVTDQAEELIYDFPQSLQENCLIVTCSSHLSIYVDHICLTISNYFPVSRLYVCDKYRDSSIRIGTDYVWTGEESDFDHRPMKEIFILSSASRQALGPTQPPIPTSIRIT
jgi:hypothetical protein